MVLVELTCNCFCVGSANLIKNGGTYLKTAYILQSTQGTTKAQKLLLIVDESQLLHKRHTYEIPFSVYNIFS